MGEAAAMAMQERIEQTKAKAHAKLQEKWARERAEKPEPELRETFVIILDDVTFSELQEIELATRGLCRGKAHFQRMTSFMKKEREWIEWAGETAGNG